MTDRTHADDPARAPSALASLVGLPAATRPPYPFTSAGATIVVEEHGSEDPSTAQEPTFVIVHGIGMGRNVFGDLIRQLGTDARVIALDLPGYGEASEPAHTLTMERTADLLAAFLIARRVRHCTLIGHSMGTQIVTEVAVRHPQLVERLVLVAPTVNIRERRALPQLLRLAQDLIGESPKVLILGTREYLRARPHLRTKMRAMLAHRPELVYGRVTVPTLVLRGEKDKVSPRAWCSFVADSIPNAQLAEIPAHGHEAMIRDAAPAAARILAWMRETQPS